MTLKPITMITGQAILLALSTCLWAECPLDHFIIGCNPDGVWGTADDNDLFVDCWQKYRDSGDRNYRFHYYPLSRAASFITDHPYRLGEPGFDAFQSSNASATYTYDPCHALAGSPQVDYSLEIRCLSLSPGLRAKHEDYPKFTIDTLGQSFSHSEIHAARRNSHMHLKYQSDDGTALRWITWQVVDVWEDGNRYHPSEPITVVFNIEPNAADIVVDGAVDILDLVSLARHWQDANACLENDYHERADTNRDGIVDLTDYQCLSDHWTGDLAPMEACAVLKAYFEPNAFLDRFYDEIQQLLSETP